MNFIVKQLPGPILPRVFPASAVIMFFDSASQTVRMPNIEFAGLQALEDIDTVHKYDPSKRLPDNRGDKI